MARPAAAAESSAYGRSNAVGLTSILDRGQFFEDLDLFVYTPGGGGFRPKYLGACPISFPSPLLSFHNPLPSPPLPLEVGALNTVRGSGGTL